MRAIVCNRIGSLEELALEEREPAAPGPGQVAIEVEAAGVNYVDGLICQGGYQIKPPVPFVPGSEVAGEVAASGEGVSEVRPGDRVVATCGFGGFAEQVTVPASSVVRLPAKVGFAQAASLLQSYCTAYFTLARRTSVRPGEWVLVLGAAGGVGLAMVDVARALGARVIAAASTEEKLAAGRAMGAEATIAYENEDLKTTARQMSGGGVDVSIDPVGGRHSEAALRATKVFGRMCVIGFASGVIPSVPLNQVLLNNRTVVGVDWGSWGLREPDQSRMLTAEVMSLVEEERLHPAIPHERPLEEAPKVLSELLGRQVTGKVVLIP